LITTTSNMSQVSHWCFTWYETDKNPIWLAEKMKYLVYQLERCPSTGKLHYQGYVEFLRSTRMSGVKKMLGSNTMHLGPRQGTTDQARHYCMKPVDGCDCDKCTAETGLRVEGTEVQEFGVYERQQGKRSDLLEVSELIKNNTSLKDIVTAHTVTYIRYHNGIEKAAKLLNTKKRPHNQTKNILLYGDSNCGKTTWASSKYPDAYTGYMPGWWQNYRGEEVAIYNEFDGKDFMNSSFFKKICDQYPVSVPAKNGDVEYLATLNIFTSNIGPTRWYDREHWDAIDRRFNHIIRCTYMKDTKQRFYQCEHCDNECDIVNDIINYFASL